MNTYKRINTITGWIVFAIAFIVYMMTVEPSASLWDCGEFITSANKLEVGHPPGAPLYMLTGRMFSLFASPENAAYYVNLVSVVTSAFTILFLFWTISFLAKKLLKIGEKAPTLEQTILIMVASATGSLAFTFSDSFWFSATESEVYAFSSFFTAFVFWAILKWETIADKPGSERWLILIAYMFGLSIGVHLLNLLVVPAICFIYYFKKKETVTKKGLVIAFILSVVILGAIQNGVIIGLPSLAYSWEITFVNEFDFSFYSGAIFFLVYLVIATIAAIALTAIKKQSTGLTLGLLAIVFNFLFLCYDVHVIFLVIFNAIFFGSYFYKKDLLFAGIISGFGWLFSIILVKLFGPEGTGSSIVLVLLGHAGSYGLWEGFYKSKTPSVVIDKIRKVFNIGLLMFSFIFIGYSSYAVIYIRSQYNTPLNENAPGKDLTKFISFLKREQYGEWDIMKGPQFTVDLNKAIKRDKNGAPIINNKTPIYKMGETKYEVVTETGDYEYKKGAISLFPRMTRNSSGHISAYKDWMREHYPKWNDKRKIKMSQNLHYMLDKQMGHMYWRYFFWNYVGREGHDHRAGKAGVLLGTNNNDEMSSYEKSKAINSYYGIPLILGLMGLLFQLMKSKKDAFVLLMMFFFTGLAIVIYLNAPPYEPRERDYAYVGSYYTFAIWIGLGAIAVWDWISSFVKSLPKVAVIGITAAICAVPVTLMASQGWDDHDRSGRYLAIDQAKALLNSCEENAILFTGGDNDTFPLWYLQEVEEFRQDVRVCNLSLLNTDWYIDQMKLQTYDSKPLPISLSIAKYNDQVNQRISWWPNNNNGQPFTKPNGVTDLKTFINNIIADDPSAVVPGSDYVYIPTGNFSMNVDLDKLPEGIIPNNFEGTATPKMQWRVGSLKEGENGFYLAPRSMDKKELIMLDIISNINEDNWKRPVYFSRTIGPDSYINLHEYLSMEGFAYRLLPVKVHEIEWNRDAYTSPAFKDIDKMYENLLSFEWRGMDDPTIFYDNPHSQMPQIARGTYIDFAKYLLDKDEKEKAIIILKDCLKKFPPNVLPYLQSFEFMRVVNRIGEKELTQMAFDLFKDIPIDDINNIDKRKKKIKESSDRSTLDRYRVYALYALVETSEAAAFLGNTEYVNKANKILENAKNQPQVTAYKGSREGRERYSLYLNQHTAAKRDSMNQKVMQERQLEQVRKAAELQSLQDSAQ